LWKLWDRIADVAERVPEEPIREDRDVLTDALNDPAGRLAEIVMKDLPARQKVRVSRQVTRRLDRLVMAGGAFGRLARARMAAEVSLLFERIPDWTAEKLLPVFDWSSPEAGAAWSAHSYSSYIGSADLVRLTKVPFLKLFARLDIPLELKRQYASWLTTIALANQGDGATYPITGKEIRTALRRAGSEVLSSVAHRLAIAMGETTRDTKVNTWRKIVGPVFQAIWPLDIDLQSSTATFDLVQILCAAGPALAEASAVVVPFIQPDRDNHIAIFSVSEEKEDFYEPAPAAVLDLLVALVGDARPSSIPHLRTALDKVEAAEPSLRGSAKFQRLLRLTTPEA
jgi:hypothetical protein